VADALLDTTFFIDIRRGDNDASTVWNSIVSGRMAASYCALSAFELWIASGMSHAEEVFCEFAFTFLEEVPVTRGAATQAAIWLRGLKTPYPEALARDALIAAVARERDEPIYTRNVRDFQRFPVRWVRY